MNFDEAMPSCGPSRKVMIKCPNTGEMISTGVQMDSKAFSSVTLKDYVTVCPECGHRTNGQKPRHFWSSGGNSQFH